MLARHRHLASTREQPCRCRPRCRYRTTATTPQEGSAVAASSPLQPRARDCRNRRKGAAADVDARVRSCRAGNGGPQGGDRCRPAVLAQARCVSVNLEFIGDHGCRAGPTSFAAHRLVDSVHVCSPALSAAVMVNGCASSIRVDRRAAAVRPVHRREPDRRPDHRTRTRLG
jgi:hypothetical protein